MRRGGLRRGSCGGAPGVCNTQYKHSKPCKPTICTAVGAYGIRPELSGICNVFCLVAMLPQRFVMCLTRWYTGRMAYEIQTLKTISTNKLHRRRGVWNTPCAPPHEPRRKPPRRIAKSAVCRGVWHTPGVPPPEPRR